jgi:hypothetical protein
MRIGRAQDSYKRAPILKIAIVGASGAGKTEWAARSPRPLIVLTEPQGLASIQTANPEAMVVLVESWEDFRKVFDAVKLAQPTEIDGQPASQATIEGQTFVFQTLVVDSFTDLQRLAINKLAGVESGSRDRLDFDSGAVNLSIEKWGQLTSGCEAVWSQQRALPCSTVFLFLAEDRTDDQQVRTTIPMLAGQKLPFSMGQYFNAVGLATVRRSGESLQHLIRWSSATSTAITKPAPGWPAVTVNTRTPGQTTLGSLLRFSFPDLPVASEDCDSSDFVSAPSPEKTSPVVPTEVQSPVASVQSSRRRQL